MKKNIDWPYYLFEAKSALTQAQNENVERIKGSRCLKNELFLDYPHPITTMFSKPQAYSGHIVVAYSSMSQLLNLD